MTADQFTVYRCKECGSVANTPGSCRGEQRVPVPVVPLGDYDRLRAALEKITTRIPPPESNEEANRMWMIARSALHGEEA